jgi:hypothetical protein
MIVSIAVSDEVKYNGLIEHVINVSFMNSAI